MDRRSEAIAALTVTSLLLSGLLGLPGQASGTPVTPTTVEETRDAYVLSGPTYRMRIDKDGFRYSFTDANGSQIVPAHAQSGVRFRATGSADFTDADTVRLVSNPHAATAVLEVTMDDGSRLQVQVFPFSTYARVTADDLPGDGGTIDFRTGPVAPAYGLGDYGAHANEQPDQGTPCGGRVQARPTTELTGIVLENLTNEGSCKRFISNFVVFPKQRFAQVMFEEGQKRVGLTNTENRLGAAGVDSVDGLYYFAGNTLEQVYADYKAARKAHDYLDARPRQRLFELGWESYGALTWNTHQQAVGTTVQSFLDHGYDLRWGIVGSGFWPGPRGNPIEGSTTSFGMWDDTCDYDPADGSYPSLPCPRYPDPAKLKQLFADNDMSLILGLRNNMKAPDLNANWNEHYDGPFAQQALEHGYFVEGTDGKPRVITSNLYPRAPQYMIDSNNQEAVDWFVEQTQKWGVDGVKEDASPYMPNLHLDGNWNPLVLALHNEGYDTIVRNAAYSVPGDVIRANDTYYGTGEDFHRDPDRLPVNLLNIAASGAPNVYGDYVGGTPITGMDDPSYQKYFTRNAWLLAVSPTMSFGRGPWQMDNPDVAGDRGEIYAAAVKDAAEFHDRMVPYIYDAVLDSHTSGYPSTMTPLPIAFPDDPATYNLANRATRQYEWMLGESLLATPVFGRDFDTAQTRDVYLPEGKWIDIETGAVFHGPATLGDYAMGADRVPAFVGGKGVLVERRDQRLTAAVYPISTASSYEWTNGDERSRIDNRNTGWEPDALVVTDTTAGERVPFTLDRSTGAFRFPLRSGHNYVLTGGGTAPHPFRVESERPSTPAGVTHSVSGGLAEKVS